MLLRLLASVTFRTEKSIQFFEAFSNGAMWLCHRPKDIARTFPQINWLNQSREQKGYSQSPDCPKHGHST